MSKKVMSKEELLANREQLVADYYATTKRNAKKPLLTKKERKVLGIGRDRGIAKAKNYRISPSKITRIAPLLIGKPVDEAIATLTYMQRAASPILIKLIKSAAANAVNNNNLSHDDLIVTEVVGNEGVTLKRIRARARGSATRILKRTSNITVVVQEKE